MLNDGELATCNIQHLDPTRRVMDVGIVKYSREPLGSVQMEEGLWSEVPIVV